jgi:hypothetical protein
MAERISSAPGLLRPSRACAKRMGRHGPVAPNEDGRNSGIQQSVEQPRIFSFPGSHAALYAAVMAAKSAGRSSQAFEAAIREGSTCLFPGGSATSDGRTMDGGTRVPTGDDEGLDTLGTQQSDIQSSERRGISQSREHEHCRSRSPKRSRRRRRSRSRKR